LNCLKKPEILVNRIYCQIFDKKIYFLAGSEENEQNQYIAEVCVFDVECEKWIEPKPTGNPPTIKDQADLLICDGQLIYYGGRENNLPTFGNLWSLPLNLPKTVTKPTKPSSSSDLTNIQKTMKQFLTEAPYSDISFEVESQIIPAHKGWLTQKSKYFMNMFSSGMTEAQASMIKISDMKATTFKAFLEFLYSDQVDLNFNLALELLQQADKYSVPELKRACEEYLAKSLTRENYATIGKIAELVDATSLRQAVVNLIAKNMRTLRKRQDFDDISDNLLRDSIVKFIVK